MSKSLLFGITTQLRIRRDVPRRVPRPTVELADQRHIFRSGLVLLCVRTPLSSSQGDWFAVPTARGSGHRPADRLQVGESDLVQPPEHLVIPLGHLHHSCVPAPSAVNLDRLHGTDVHRRIVGSSRRTRGRVICHLVGSPMEEAAVGSATRPWTTSRPGHQNPRPLSLLQHPRRTNLTKYY